MTEKIKYTTGLYRSMKEFPTIEDIDYEFGIYININKKQKKTVSYKELKNVFSFNPDDEKMNEMIEYFILERFLERIENEENNYKILRK